MVIINAPTIGLVKCEVKWIEEGKAHGTINIETPPSKYSHITPINKMEYISIQWNIIWL